jgi:hypothetical protein
VFSAYSALAALIAAMPVIAFIDGPIIQGIVEAVVAFALAVVALSLPPGEGRHLSRLIAPIAIGLALPAAWMIVQAVPVPLESLSHPIWASAAAALHKTLTGSISADPGVTLVALARYATVAGVLVAAAAVSIDRRRAERLLFWLTGIGALAGISLVAGSYLGMAFMETQPQATQSLVALCGLAAPICAAASAHVFERYERRRSSPGTSPMRFRLAFVASLGAVAACLGGVAQAATSQMLLIALCGCAIVAIVVAMRRAGLGFWAGAAALATASIVFIALVTARGGRSGDLALRYAGKSGPEVAIAERLMSDTSWTGSGAGTYSALAPIYRDAGGKADVLSPPTTAAAISVELGRPALFVILALAASGIGLQLRGALSRGRDSLYAAAAAGSTLVATLAALGDAGGLERPAAIFAAAAFGLGIAQSAGRTLGAPG